MANPEEKFEIKNRAVWENSFMRLVKKLQNEETLYPKSFENEVFKIRASKDGDKKEPNFLYKPNGFEIYWVDYFFKIGTYINRDIDTKAFFKIMADCSESLNKKKRKK